MRSNKILFREGEEPQYLPAKCEGIKVKSGDLLYFNTWGGGGWGDPLDRDPSLVLQDFNRKLVSQDGARRYGVVIENNEVDVSATDKLREEMRGARSPIEMFNFGGSLDDIKAHCLDQTKLPAPDSPAFITK